MRKSYYALLASTIAGTCLICLLSCVVFHDVGDKVALGLFAVGIIGVVIWWRSAGIQLQQLKVVDRLCIFPLMLIVLVGLIVSIQFSKSGIEWGDRCVARREYQNAVLSWAWATQKDCRERPKDDPAFSVAGKMIVFDAYEDRFDGRGESKTLDRKKFSQPHYGQEWTPTMADFESDEPVTVFVAGFNYKEKVIGEWREVGTDIKVGPGRKITADVCVFAWPDRQPIGKVTIMYDPHPPHKRQKESDRQIFARQVTDWLNSRRSGQGNR